MALYIYLKPTKAKVAIAETLRNKAT